MRGTFLCKRDGLTAEIAAESALAFVAETSACAASEPAPALSFGRVGTLSVPLPVILFVPWLTLLTVRALIATFAVLSAVIVPVAVDVPVAESAAVRPATTLSLLLAVCARDFLGKRRDDRRVAFRNVNVRDALDRAEIGFLFGVHECDCGAVFAGARGASDAVNISLRDFR